MAFEIKPESYYLLSDLEAEGVAKIATLRRWIKSGKLRASIVGKSYFVLGSDLLDLLTVNAGRVKDPSPWRD